MSNNGGMVTSIKQTIMQYYDFQKWPMTKRNFSNIKFGGK